MPADVRQQLRDLLAKHHQQRLFEQPQRSAPGAAAAAADNALLPVGSKRASAAPTRLADELAEAAAAAAAAEAATVGDYEISRDPQKQQAAIKDRYEKHIRFTNITAKDGHRQKCELGVLWGNGAMHMRDAEKLESACIGILECIHCSSAVGITPKAAAVAVVTSNPASLTAAALCVWVCMCLCRQPSLLGMLPTYTGHPQQHAGRPAARRCAGCRGGGRRPV